MFLHALDTTGFPIATDGSGGNGSQAVTTRKMEEERLNITRDTLKKIKVVIVLQDEGIVYCPIPKVNDRGVSERRTDDCTSL